MDPSELVATVMDPATRTLKQITMGDAQEAATTFLSLMGECVEPRRKFIQANAARANIDI